MPAAHASSLTRPQVRSIGFITATALGIYVAMRFIPSGSDLNHMDFRVDEKGAIEFCDPNSPQFIPVVTAKSPVELKLVSDVSPTIGQPVTFSLTMLTAGGKPIGPADLLVAHTRKLHLLVVDPTLSDYQHIHPEPGKRAGEWVFRMIPQRPGKYRVFADFMPAATGRGLYAGVDFDVPGEVPRVSRTTNATFPARGYNFELVTPSYFRAATPASLTFRIERQGSNKTPVPLEPVMDAYAHLVAFDEARSGFAHLHPDQTDLTKLPGDPTKPELMFKVTIPSPGRYVIWAQVKLAGDETFVPFWVEVLP